MGDEQQIRGRPTNDSLENCYSKFGKLAMDVTLIPTLMTGVARATSQNSHRSTTRNPLLSIVLQRNDFAQSLFKPGVR